MSEILCHYFKSYRSWKPCSTYIIIYFLGQQSLFYSVGGLSSSSCLATHSQRQTWGTEAFFRGPTTPAFCSEPQVSFCCVGEADRSPVSGSFSLPRRRQGGNKWSARFYVSHRSRWLTVYSALARSLKRQREDGRGRAEAEETRALLDLLRCPHSRWHLDQAWSPEAAPLRAGCAGCSEAPRQLYLCLCYHPPYSGKSCEFLSGGGPSDLIWLESVVLWCGVRVSHWEHWWGFSGFSTSNPSRVYLKIKPSIFLAFFLYIGLENQFLLDKKSLALIYEFDNIEDPTDE